MKHFCCIFGLENSFQRALGPELPSLAWRCYDEGLAHCAPPPFCELFFLNKGAKQRQNWTTERNKGTLIFIDSFYQLFSYFTVWTSVQWFILLKKCPTQNNKYCLTQILVPIISCGSQLSELHGHLISKHNGFGNRWLFDSKQQHNICIFWCSKI